MLLNLNNKVTYMNDFRGGICLFFQIFSLGVKGQTSGEVYVHFP